MQGREDLLSVRIQLSASVSYAGIWRTTTLPGSKAASVQPRLRSLAVDIVIQSLAHANNAFVASRFSLGVNVTLCATTASTPLFCVRFVQPVHSALTCVSCACRKIATFQSFALASLSRLDRSRSGYNILTLIGALFCYLRASLRQRGIAWFASATRLWASRGAVAVTPHTT